MSFWSPVTRRRPASKDCVVAHILDPITGYSNRDLRIGRDIDIETVRRLGVGREVFVVVDYEGGVPTATVRTRIQWLRAQAEQDESQRPVDASVWRRREELKIG
jgi:hypothetical protein